MTKLKLSDKVRTIDIEPRADRDWTGIHTRPNGDDFEVYRRYGQFYWRNCYTDREGFVVEHLGSENGPFTTSYEAYCDAA